MKMPTRAIRDHTFTLTPTPAADLDLSGKRLAIVGGTGGLGGAIAALALARGAEIIVVGRTLRHPGAARSTFMEADLSLMREAARVGRELEVEQADAVLFTTGIIAAKTREETAEGLERDMAVSFLNRLAILRGLHGRIGVERRGNAAQARVFVMGSPGYGARGELDDLNSLDQYSAMFAHNNTIAGNEALAIAGAERYPGPAYFGLAPGLVKTGIRANLLGERTVSYKLIEALIGMLAPSPGTYAARTLPALFAPELKGRTGVLFDNKARSILPTRGFDAAYAQRYLAASESLLDQALSR